MVRVRDSLGWCGLCALLLVLAGCPTHLRNPQVASPVPPAANTAAPAVPEAPGGAAGEAAPPDPLATPPPGATLATSPAAASTSDTFKPLPADLNCREYPPDGIGLLVDIFASGIKPQATRAEPADISFAIVAQTSMVDRSIIRWHSQLHHPVAGKLRGGQLQLTATPRFNPQKIGLRTPGGEVPAAYEGWLDVELRDSHGKPLVRFGVSGSGWVDLAPAAQQPADVAAQTTGEGTARGQFFDFFPHSGGDALLRMEAVEHGKETFTVRPADGSLHDIQLPHAALRFLLPGQFVTTAQHRQEESYPRDPEKEHEEERRAREAERNGGG